MNGDALGPAFDTATLIRPTQRKLVGCWMESAGCATLILPEVWRELTRNAGSGPRFRAADAWVRLAELPGTDWDGTAGYPMLSPLPSARFAFRLNGD